MGDTEDHLVLYAKYVSLLVKEQFSSPHQQNELKQLIAILEKGVNGVMDMETLISETSILFGDNNNDLLEKLISFIPIEKRAVGKAITACIDLLQQAALIHEDSSRKFTSFQKAITGFCSGYMDGNLLKDEVIPIYREYISPDFDTGLKELISSSGEERFVKSMRLIYLVGNFFEDKKLKYNKFIKAIMEYGQQKDVDRLEVEAFPFVSKHPSLDLLFSKFLLSQKQGEPLFEYLKHPGPFKFPKLIGSELKRFLLEEEMHESDLFKPAVKSVKKSAKRFIKKNKRKNPDEGIVTIGKHYFNMGYLKIISNRLGEKYFSTIVSKKMVPRRTVIHKCEMIVSILRKEYKDFKSQESKDQRKKQWKHITAAIVDKTTFSTKRIEWITE